MSPMSECDSTVFSEGYLTTSDSKDEKHEHGEGTFFQNGTCANTIIKHSYMQGKSCSLQTFE